ncbi:MAG: hypothetical protein ACOZIN_04265 [Myxococcota bacterium]
MRRFLPLVLAAIAFLGADALAQRRAKRGASKKSAPTVKIKPSETAPLDEPAPAPTSGPPPGRGPTRIDFDDRLIQGQSNKSGAVYLYDRKELKTRSMIKKRESFREEIIGAVYDE